MNESDAAWTPAYESIAEALREAEARTTRYERTLLLIDVVVASATALYLLYVLL